VRTIPSIDIIADYLGVEPAALREPQGEKIVTTTNLVHLLLKMALHRTEFDAEGYLQRYPDVAAALNDRAITAPLDHFASTGYFEGRVGCEERVDEDWYRANNPDVRIAINEGRVASAEEHYRTIGIREWRAPRPDMIKEIQAWRAALLA
jgi:hypothetical protein